MLKKLRLITGTLMICLAFSQMTGCLIPKEENRFTGKWVIQDAGTPQEKRSCVEGGSQCAAVKTGLDVKPTPEVGGLFK